MSAQKQRHTPRPHPLVGWCYLEQERCSVVKGMLGQWLGDYCNASNRGVYTLSPLEILQEGYQYVLPWYDIINSNCCVLYHTIRHAYFFPYNPCTGQS